MSLDIADSGKLEISANKTEGEIGKESEGSLVLIPCALASPHC